MTIIRLDPPIWLHTPKGEAMAHFLIAETEMDLVWVCFQQDTGECWSWSNQDVRAQSNLTIGRKIDKNYCKAVPKQPVLEP